MPQSDTSATVKPLCARYFGSARNSRFLPSAERIQTPFFAIIRRVAQTLVQKIVRISVTFHRSRYPQTVDINVTVRFDWYPRVFRGNVLDKTFAALFAAIKYQSFVETTFQPLFFRQALNTRHRATNMFFVNIVFRDSYIIHIVAIRLARTCRSRIPSRNRSGARKRIRRYLQVLPPRQPLLSLCRGRGHREQQSSCRGRSCRARVRQRFRSERTARYRL